MPDDDKKENEEVRYEAGFDFDLDRQLMDNY
jgi:hypothetical protein